MIIRLGVYGGFFYCVGELLMGSSARLSEGQKAWAPLATAFGALIAKFVWQVVQTDRFQNSVNIAFDADITNAKRQQSQGNDEALTLSIVYTAWTRFTGEAPPPPSAYLVSLEAKMNQDIRDDLSKPADLSSPLMTLWGYLCDGYRLRRLKVRRALLRISRRRRGNKK
jgi:hypothetical protein